MSELNISLLQVVMILLTVQTVGWIFKKMGQPMVVGEMIAGLLLGPSLYGRLAPGAFAFTYPPEHMDVLFTLSRLGIWLFMFLVGLELNLFAVQRMGKLVVIASQCSVLLPLALGSTLAIALYPEFAGAGTSFASFALFMGVAMSITAFPVLARILRDRSMTGTQIGSMSIACAAANDVTAWCLLSITVLVIQPSGGELTMAFRVFGLMIYFGFIWFAARPLLRRAFAGRSRLTSELFAATMVMLFLSCIATQVIGIHALFGAFFLGVVMPKHEWLVKALEERIEPLTTTLLLPLFFAFSGIRTNVGLINDWRELAVCVVIIAVAVYGKFAGAAIPARIMGQSWRNASALGALMNTRGLMELVILNVGLELNVISPTLFSMMIIMAVVTTFMTTPWLDQIMKDRPNPLLVATGD